MQGACGEAASGTLDPLGGSEAPGTRCLVLSSVQGTNEFYLGIAYCWKCELASLSIHTHQIFACLWLVEPGIAFQRFAPLHLPSSLSVAAPDPLLAPQSLPQNRHLSPSSPTTCSPISNITKESPFPLYL